ncbi:MAG: Maf family protein [Microbacteriaceae bacterium]
MRLYLASTSPARLATLRAVGVEPVVIPSAVDEDAAVAIAGTLTAVAMVELLARLKAEAVLERGPEGFDGFVIGCDSAFELDGVTYGKPYEPEVARERWMLQRGREGMLHSGHWLIDVRDGKIAGAAGAVSTSAVRFASNITDEEIDAYVATGEPLQVAGAFTIDSLGAPFISEIRGDPHAVVGLSVAKLRELLADFGVGWTTMWNRDL